MLTHNKGHGPLVTSLCVKVFVVLCFITTVKPMQDCTAALNTRFFKILCSSWALTLRTTKYHFIISWKLKLKKSQLNQIIIISRAFHEHKFESSGSTCGAYS